MKSDEGDEGTWRDLSSWGILEANLKIEFAVL